MPDSVDSQIVRLIERQATQEESQKHLIKSIDKLAVSMDNVVNSNNKLLVSQSELKTQVEGVVDRLDLEINSVKSDVSGIGVRMTSVEEKQKEFDNFISKQEGSEETTKSYREKSGKRTTITLTIISLSIAVVGLAYKIISEGGN